MYFFSSIQISSAVENNIVYYSLNVLDLNATNLQYAKFDFRENAYQY